MPPNAYIRDYDCNLDFRSVTTVTGVNTSDASSLIVLGGIGSYGGYSGISFEGAAFTRVANYGNSGDSAYHAVWHLPNCPKNANGTVTFNGASGYSWFGNVVVVNGHIKAHDGRGEQVNGAAYEAYTFTLNNGKLNDFLYAYMDGSNNPTSPTGTALWGSNPQSQYKSGCAIGNNSLGMTRGSPGGYVTCAGAYFTPAGIGGTMMFLEKWRQRMINNLIRQGGIQVGRKVLTPI